MRFFARRRDQALARSARDFDDRYYERRRHDIWCHGMWGGDGSVPNGTLVPIWRDDPIEPCPLPGQWDYCDGRVSTRGVISETPMPDLRGFLGCPNWARQLNGQSVSNVRFELNTTPVQ